MPDVTITAPVAADSVERLTLRASDARGGGGHGYVPTGSCTLVAAPALLGGRGLVCMAEE
jgi:hypothetical protein